MEFITTNGQNHRLIAGGNQTINGTGTQYFPVVGSLAITTSVEASQQLSPQFAHSASNMETFVVANNLPSATLSFRKNGANGNQSISIGSLATGYFEDTVNSDVLTSTDSVNYQLITGGTSTISNIQISNFGYLISQPSAHASFLPILGVG